MTAEQAPTSSSQPSQRSALLAHIQTKRTEVAKFITSADGRNRRLTNTAIICGTISAALTAGPALGGKSVNTWLSEIFPIDMPIWQLLCFGAMVCSVAATIATNMSKSHEVAAKLILAQACKAKLEGLQAQAEHKSLDVKQASDQFAKLLAEISFV